MISANGITLRLGKRALFEDVNMVEADSYDFICSDGFSEEIAKEDLEKVALFFEGERVDASSIAYAPYTLMNIEYIVPHGLEAENAAEFEVEEGKVAKITVVNTVAAAAEPDFFGPSGGTVQTGYRVSDVLAAAGLENAGGTVTAISFGDGSNALHATKEIAFADFAERYIVPNDSKDRGAYTVGRNQAYNDVTINVGCYVLGENILLFIPDSAADKATGILLSDVLTLLGVEYTAVNVVCSDGFSEVIDAADMDDVKIYHVKGKVDVDSVAYAGYTLADAVSIEILK